MDVYTLVVIVTFIAFVGLAALLLFPVYFFLKREERVSQRWTTEEIRRRIEEAEERAAKQSISSSE